MTYIAVCTVVLLIVAIAWCARFVERLPEAYRRRSCQGTGWRRRFPGASKEQIRAFLSVFAESFAFAQADKLKFSPDDKVLDVYRALYPKRWLPDALEVEMFAKELEGRFAVRLEPLWSEQLTLGDVFDAVQAVA
jgi:hypothetical protein